MTPFEPIDPKQPLASFEPDILRYWKIEDTFKRSIKNRKPKSKSTSKHADEFTFYDGPPFATGLPHYGHLLAGTIKDVILRYQTMQGKYAERRFGWDCHGLPIENLIEKEQNITDHKQITEELGIDTFCEMCRSAVQRYTQDWRTTVERMGRWVDMDHDYKTMDPEYMESIWWAFEMLYKQDLIYEGHKPMHICPRCVTTLSNFEVTQGYSDRTDLSVVMTFPLVEDPNTVLLAWTTTPWSLPGNLWLLVGPNIEYVRVQEAGSTVTYICAANLVEKLFKGKEYTILGSISAQELAGKKYEPLFPYFTETIIPKTAANGTPQTYGERCFTILLDTADEVSDSDGTGIVHITNSHGEDGYRITSEQNIDVLHHVNLDGSFVPEVDFLQGKKVKPEGDDPMATDKLVIQELKNRGRYFSSYSFTHSYPHCWRCDTPLLNYATSSWFVRIEAIKEQMIANKEQTTWVPSHLKDGRYGQWLENARDWAISRNRFWGTPLPIWRTESGQIEVIGSRDQLLSKAPNRFTKITALRHAESLGNVERRFQGVPPGTDLTDKGQNQAEATADYLQNNEHKVAIIYASPLARCQQTAAAIAKKTGATIITDDRLIERQFGEHEGATIPLEDKLYEREARAKKHDNNSPDSIFCLDGMEDWGSVNTRMCNFLRDILPKHRSDHIVIVAHASPIRAIQHFITKEDEVKISHQPYPSYAEPVTYFWDHDNEVEMDLHKHRIDDITWQSDAGEVFTRIPEVLDCWFESGSMPYAKAHFPFEPNAGSVPAGFPADFIAEGVDQCRAWFYTLMALNTALFGKTPFEHVVVNGIVLAEDGKKMSKKLKNYPDPLEITEKYGADSIRFALMNSPAVRGEDLRMSEQLVEQSMRSVLLPLWNTFSFFVTYANAANFDPTAKTTPSTHSLDIWITAEIQDLINRMTHQLDAYDLSATCSELFSTIDALTNWYIRLSRRRFAGKDTSKAGLLDQTMALQTLYTVLLELSKLLAPFCPFIAEKIYLHLTKSPHDSVHLTDWSAVRELTAEESKLLRKIRTMRTIVSLGLSVRGEATIKNRQPLRKATIAVPPDLHAGADFTAHDLLILQQELNVKAIEFATDPKELATTFVFVDARAVGPRLGKRVQEVITAGKRGDFTQNDDGSFTIAGEVITAQEATVRYQSNDDDSTVAASGGIVVQLDTTLTEELEQEGVARDIIRTIQRLRKQQGYEFTDTLTVAITGNDNLLQKFSELITRETNTVFGAVESEATSETIGDTTFTFAFRK